MDRPQVAALVVSGAQRPSTKAPSGPAEPLAPIAGVAVQNWVIDAAIAASITRVAFVGDDPDQALTVGRSGRADGAVVEFVLRSSVASVEVLADAVERLGPDLSLRDSSHLLVLPAEAPQIRSDDLRVLIDEHLTLGAVATVVGTDLEPRPHDEPAIIRDDAGRIRSILDRASTSASPTVGIFRAPLLLAALRRVTPRGWVGPPLLADAADALEAAGHVVARLAPDRPLTVIETMADRAPIEMALREQIVWGWIGRGVAMPDPRQVSIDARAEIGHAVEVLPGTVIDGPSVIADGAVIGPNTHLVDATIGAGAHVPHSVVRRVDIAPHARVEPFSVLGDLTT